MKNIFTLGFFGLLTTIVSAQQIQEINIGQGYNKQSFIKLSTGTEKLVNNDAWDLAFTAFGFQDAGIFINESSGSSMGQNLPQTELYYAQTDDFNAVIDIAAIVNEKYLNSEASWAFGAFNELRDVLNPFDFGWGSYNPSNNQVIGDKVFVFKLRNGEYRKIKIISLIGTTYTFKYAKLDGTSEVTKTINKTTDNKGQKLIFFSFLTNQTVDVLPAEGFDLMYCRYIALATDPNGTLTQQYNVTGVLTGLGVSAVKADGIDPVTVSYSEFKNDLSTRPDVIGFDWKSLVGTSWTLDQDRVFFVKTADKHVWKLRFIDFEGSSTGKTILQKTEIGDFSAAQDFFGIDVGIYPNPVGDQIFVAFDAKDIVSNSLAIRITDVTGKIVLHQQISKVNGFSVFEVNASDWQKGVYLISLTNAGKPMLTKKITKI
ncbi:MAG: T9SS type A sorting domain-containing protein [Saprospiraceae bacterium]|nr:T9SS type A sorting domain-containing protein [Saprospiraceae bacterium]